MRKLVLTAGAMAVLVSSVAHAAEWRPVGNTAEEVWFLDTSSLLAVSGSKVAWVKTETKSGAVKDDGAKYSILKYASHCKTRQLQIMSWSNYGRDGKVILSSAHSSQSNEVYPDSIGEGLLNAMCNPSSLVRKRDVVKDTAKFTEEYFAWADGNSSTQ